MKNRIRRHTACALLTAALGLALAPGAAQAVLVDITATGEVDMIVNAIVDAEFDIGDPMSVTMTYDAATAPDGSLILTQALYAGAIVSGTFTVGTYSGSIFGGNINISDDDVDFDDTILFRGFATGPDLSATLAARGFLISLTDPTTSAISDKALPLSTADIAGFPVMRWGVPFGSAIGTEPPGVSGFFDSLELTVRESVVPEPSTAALVAASTLLLLVALAGGRRRPVEFPTRG